MSDHRSELAINFASLEAARDAAVGSLDHTSGSFTRLKIKTGLPMGPDFRLEDFPEQYGSCTSNVVLFGGRTADELGNRAYGHIEAELVEPTASGILYHEHPMIPRTPLIPRILTVQGGRIALRTSMVNPPLEAGPLIVKRIDGASYFTESTVYHVGTGAVIVEGGEVISDGSDTVSRRITEHDTSDLPDAILLPRLANVIRAIKSTATILTHVATPNDKQVRFTVTV